MNYYEKTKKLIPADKLLNTYVMADLLLKLFNLTFVDGELKWEEHDEDYLIYYLIKTFIPLVKSKIPKIKRKNKFEYLRDIRTDLPINGISSFGERYYYFKTKETSLIREFIYNNRLCKTLEEKYQKAIEYLEAPCLIEETTKIYNLCKKFNNEELVDIIDMGGISLELLIQNTNRLYPDTIQYKNTVEMIDYYDNTLPFFEEFVIKIEDIIDSKWDSMIKFMKIFYKYQT